MLSFYKALLSRWNQIAEVITTGVMSELTAPLAKSSIAVFAISTYNTDFILIHDADRVRAVDALRSEGWTVDDLG
jgi:hypothetical protein